MGDESPEQPEGAGQVHYQISITGRQAAAFFLMLLAALGLSFFFGMKTGAAARKGPEVLAQLAGSTEVPAAAVSEKEKPDAAPTPEPAEKKLGFEDTTPAAPVAATAAAPAATPVPEPTKPAAESVERVAEKPAAKPTARPAAKAPEKTAEKTSEKAPAAASKAFHVQIFATKDGKKADDLVKKLKKEGFKADVATSPKNAELFVVRVGPFGDKAKAEAQRKKILKSNPGLKGLMVVPS